MNPNHTLNRTAEAARLATAAHPEDHRRCLCCGLPLAPGVPGLRCHPCEMEHRAAATPHGGIKA